MSITMPVTVLNTRAELEPVDYYVTFTLGPASAYLLHRDETCTVARDQEMGAFYTKSEARIVLRNRDVPACPCVL